MKNTTSRRHFLGAAIAAPLLGSTLLAAQSEGEDEAELPGKGKKLLVLGGTVFLGPAIVDYAISQGYEVTLFNRGKSNPDMYPGLEKLRGDRNANDLESLKEGKWDSVVDTSCYLPRHAREAAEVLKDRVGHYVLISTISVYSEFANTTVEGGVIHEDSPVGRITAEQVAEVKTIQDAYRVGGGSYYGPLKALAEEALEEMMPGRVTSLRPGVIAGRDDPSDRLPYWVVRVNEGGEVLCPGDPNFDFQYTDVRDLGRWSVDFGMQKKAGIFNAIGFDGKVTMQEFLHGVKVVLGPNNTTFTWCSEQFLTESEVRPFSEMPFWLPKEVACRASNTKGIAAGMTFRPLADTIHEVIDWHMEKRGPDHKWGYYGMKREREAELLAEWHGKAAEESE